MVEVMIASAIILAAVLALLGVHSLYLQTALANSDTAKAAYLAEEGIEAMRYLRDDSWSAKIAPLSPSTNYAVVLSGGVWQTDTSSFYVGHFERVITVAPVARDEATGDIVSSGGADDPDTRLVVSTVSWPSRGATSTRSIATYLTNLYEE